MASSFKLDAAQLLAAQGGQFQNVFDFPDFVELRPLLRAAVRQVAKDQLETASLPVQLERQATVIEERLERETRKFEHQRGYYGNQRAEKQTVVQLFTAVLRALSQNEPITQEVEDAIYAVNQTRLSLLQLTELAGTGPLYEENHDQELLPGTFYYLVAAQLAKPYFKDPAGPFQPANVTKPGREWVARITAYAFRDWDTYLVHRYDEEHNLANQRGLTRTEYYDRLEQLAVKYADHHYAEVLADLFKRTQALLADVAEGPLAIMTSDVAALLARFPLKRLAFEQAVRAAFMLDSQGRVHVMDEPLRQVHAQYAFYRTHFGEDE